MAGRVRGVLLEVLAEAMRYGRWGTRRVRWWLRGVGVVLVALLRAIDRSWAEVSR
jgi:hypothetical protein